MLEPSHIRGKGPTIRSHQKQVVAFLDVLIEAKATANGAQYDGFSFCFKCAPRGTLANYCELNLQWNPFGCAHSVSLGPG